MACRNCGTDVAPVAWACPACGRRLRSRLAESWAVVREVLAGATATARGLRCGFLAAIGSAVVLPGLVTLALLALAVPSAAGLAVSALAAAMPVPLYTLVILWLDRTSGSPRGSSRRLSSGAPSSRAPWPGPSTRRWGSSS